MTMIDRNLLAIVVLLAFPYLVISQNDTLTILSNGNVGVGISNPSTAPEFQGIIKGENLISEDSITAKTTNFENHKSTI